MAVYWFASLFGQKGTYGLGLVPVRKHLKNMYGFFIPANIIDKFKAVVIFKQARMATFIPNFHTSWVQILFSRCNLLLYMLRRILQEKMVHECKRKMVHLKRISLCATPREDIVPNEKILPLPLHSLKIEAIWWCEVGQHLWLSVFTTASCEMSPATAIEWQLCRHKWCAIDRQRWKSSSRSWNSQHLY